MAIEKHYLRVGPRALTSDGNSGGRVIVEDTALFKVKQKVTLSADTLPNKSLEIKRVVNKTTLFVGEVNKSILDRTDISNYTVALNATIEAPEQQRPNIPSNDIIRSVFSEEPTLAIRSLLVDVYGDQYTVENPFPVRLSDGNVNIGTVNAEIEVQLTHLDNFPDSGDVFDSVRIGDGENTATITKALSGLVSGLDIVSKNSIFSKPFTKLEVLSKDDDGNPLEIKTSYGISEVQLAILEYDLDGDFVSVEVIDI